MVIHTLEAILGRFFFSGFFVGVRKNNSVLTTPQDFACLHLELVIWLLSSSQAFWFVLFLFSLLLHYIHKVYADKPLSL